MNLSLVVSHLEKVGNMMVKPDMLSHISDVS